MKSRFDRRACLPVENPIAFYLRYGWEIVSRHARYMKLVAELRWFERKLNADPESLNYRDASSAVR